MTTDRLMSRIYWLSLLCIGCGTGTGFAGPHDRAGSTDSASLTAERCPAVRVTRLAINQGVEIVIADGGGPVLASAAPVLAFREGALKITFSPTSDWSGGEVNFRIVTAEGQMETDVLDARAFVAAGPQTTSVYKYYTLNATSQTVRIDLVRPEGCQAPSRSEHEGLTDLSGRPVQLDAAPPRVPPIVHFVLPVHQQGSGNQRVFEETLLAYEQQLSRWYPSVASSFDPENSNSAVVDELSPFDVERTDDALSRLETLQKELQAEWRTAVFVIGVMPGHQIFPPKAFVGERAAIVPLGKYATFDDEVEPAQIALAVNATLASALTAQHEVLVCRAETDAPFDAVGVEGYDIHRRAPIPATTSRLFQPKEEEEEEESGDSDDLSSRLTECEGGWIDPATYGEVFVRETDT